MVHLFHACETENQLCSVCFTRKLLCISLIVYSDISTDISINEFISCFRWLETLSIINFAEYMRIQNVHKAFE